MTVTKDPTLADRLNNADPNNIADALRQVRLGDILVPQEWVSGVMPANASVQPPGGCLSIQSIRVTAVGTAALGQRTPSDSSAAPSATVASVSADGSTITFEGTVTNVTVRYIKLPAAPAATVVATQG